MWPPYRDLVYVDFSFWGALVSEEERKGVNIASVRLPSLGATLSEYVEYGVCEANFWLTITKGSRLAFSAQEQ